VLHSPRQLMHQTQQSLPPPPPPAQPDDDNYGPGPIGEDMVAAAAAVYQAAGLNNKARGLVIRGGYRVPRLGSISASAYASLSFSAPVSAQTTTIPDETTSPSAVANPSYSLKNQDPD
jgi:hypothetical protein